MPEEPPDLPGPLILDACSIICLEAADVLERIFSIAPDGCLIASEVLRESQWVYSWPHEDGSQERLSIDLAAHAAQGRIRIVTPETEAEAQTFVHLATSEMDNGEAMSAAIALHRRAILVTDERKAAAYCTRENVACLTSLDLLRAWELRDRVPAADVARALNGVLLRARYRPPRSHPLLHWWTQHMGE